MSTPSLPGYFGEFGGAWVPETLVPAVEALEAAYQTARADPSFQAELSRLLAEYGGRPTPLWEASRLSKHAGGARILLKREDLVHGGAHKFNNVMGQALLAKRMGRTRLIAETGAGQHGVATAMAGAVLGLPVEVYMGSKDVERQALNVFRMRLMGAKVHSVPSGSATLKNAVNEALRDWAGDPHGTFYCIGSAVGPHPYPSLVRDFQRVIGDEARAQCLEQTGSLPEAAIACVGGGSNAIGTFTAFLDDPVRLIGVEAAGAASIGSGSPGILHGSRSLLLQDTHGQVEEAHSISAGLDYPGVGPEHANLHALRRATYTQATDQEALDATLLLCRLEGILPALESAHAVAAALRIAPTLRPDQSLLVTVSGRGDKDIHTLLANLGDRI